MVKGTDPIAQSSLSHASLPSLGLTHNQPPHTIARIQPSTMTSTSCSQLCFPPQSTSLGEVPRQNSHDCGSTPRHNVKTLAEHALAILQTTSSLVAGAAGDLAIPGLSIGLTALAEFLKKIQVCILQRVAFS